MQEEYKNKRKELAVAISKVVNNLLKQNNKSATLFADEINISKTTILNLKKGILDPQISTIFKISFAFNIKPSKMLELIEKELPEKWDILDN